MMISKRAKLCIWVINSRVEESSNSVVVTDI